MHYRLAFATLAVLIGNDFATAQHIPPTTTAAELWNPWTWFWPYAVATAEGYRDYFQKAQKATNELYQQIYKTNAFPWVTGNWGQPQTNPGAGGEQNNQSGGGGQNSQNGDNAQSNQGNSTQSGGGGQNSQNGDNGQSNQGNSTQSGDSGQNGQNGDNGQSNQGNSTQSDNKPADENKQNQTTNGTQVQGDVSVNGTNNAQVNGTV